MDLDKKQKDQLATAVNTIKEKLPDVLGVYLFGSFGTKYETEQSDIDLAIYLEHALGHVELWELSEEIARKINRDVQIVDLMEASTVFKFQIVTTGERVYCQNNSKCDAFETTCISMYLRFNEERKEILDSIKAPKKDEDKSKDG